LSKEPEIEVRYESIEKEVVKYIPSNESCNLTIGAASLLNDSAQPMLRVGHPPIPDAEKHRASPVTQLESVETCIKWAKQYNKLARRHDALIDVLEQK